MNTKKPKTFTPLYQHLFEHYRDAIIEQKLNPGQQIHSIHEIQQIHNVSRETAKLVLKMLARQGLIIQKPGKGSFVVDHRPTKALWGVIVPFYSIQYENLIEKISAHAARIGRTVRHFVDYNDWKRETRLVGTLLTEGYEAIIIVPTSDESYTAEFYRHLSPQGTYITLVDHTMAGSFFSYIIQSYDLGVERAVQYLLEKTDRTHTFVRNELWSGRNMVQELMEARFCQSIRSSSPRPDPLVADRVSQIDEEYITANDIGGIFCCDDTDALRIAGRLIRQGIAVGSDIHLVSYGNTDIAAFFTPAITSVDPHNDEMAERVSRIIENHIQGEDTSLCQYIVQPELIVRET
jgi:DNA-binding LacI/PurR family transcriptional regulator